MMALSANPFWARKENAFAYSLENNCEREILNPFAISSKFKIETFRFPARHPRGNFDQSLFFRPSLLGSIRELSVVF